MNLIWSQKSLSDLSRLYEFLAIVNPPAAASAIQSLTTSTGRLLQHPRIGERLEQYHLKEVRRIIVGNYELHYEIQGMNIYIVRLWHTREKR